MSAGRSLVELTLDELASCDDAAHTAERSSSSTAGEVQAYLLRREHAWAAERPLPPFSSGGFGLSHQVKVGL